MTSPHREPHDLESLLVQDAFVRRLARQLVRDPHAADDAVQETWLAAMHGGPKDADEPQARGFLATVLRRLVQRHHRGERRELARRARVAKDKVVPSPDEILAREAQRADVVRLVLALDPPQRDVVLLRFFEHLPPRAIAQRLEVPVETVRTRLKRALAKLRAQLDERHGGRAAWLVFLQPLADAPLPPAWPTAWPTTLGPTLLAGGLGMSAQKVLAIALAVAVLALGWWTLVPPSEASLQTRTTDGDTALARTKVVANAAPTLDATHAAEIVPTAERSVAPAAPTPTTGALTVRVVLAADDSPVPDYVVDVDAGPDELFDRRRLHTGLDGTATFPDLPLRRLYATTFPNHGCFSDLVTIEAGKTATATIRLQRVMDVQGEVVDAAGRAVANAEILVADWTGMQTLVVARTAADGTFARRAVAIHCHIGARAAGFAASPLRQFTASDGAKATVRIVLDTVAAEVRGRVLDTTGRAVADAVVRCGDLDQHNERLPDGGMAMRWRPELTATDSDGRFVLRHLPTGKHALAVRAKGLAPATQEIEITAGRAAEFTIVLVPGVTLVGRATDAAGNAVRAEVTVGEWRDLGARRVRAAADGTFRIEGLAMGTLEASAMADGLEPLKSTIHGSAGETVTWHPVLSRGRVRHGRVLDADGKPAAQATVRARLANGEEGEYWAHERTDADGRFTLTGCPDRPLRIDVARTSTFPEVVLPRVEPSDDELRIELPRGEPVYLVGTVLGPDGTVLPVVGLSPFRTLADNSPSEAADPATGAFRLGPYPPGEYALTLTAMGFPDIRVPKRTVASGETWDLGEQRFQKGGDLVCALLGTQAQLGTTDVTVRTPDGAWITSMQAKDGSGRTGPLPPGDYRLHVVGETAAAVVVPFTIRGGEVTRLDVPLHAGTKVTFVAKLPAQTPGRRMLEFAVRDGDDRLVAEPATWAEDGIATIRIALPPGRYRLAANAEGDAGTARFEVAAGVPELRVECALTSPR